MKCPACLAPDTRVLDSRPNTETITIRRRRECDKCGFRFSTVESVEILDLTVIKKDQRRESYSRGKLEEGIRQALQKREYSPDAYEKLISAIERDIQLKRTKHEIQSEEIGKIVLKYLKKFDKVAYIRFASVYQAFDSIDEFVEAVDGVNKNKKKT